MVQPPTPGRSSDQDAGVDKDYGLYQASDESSEEEEALMSYKADSISTIVLENANSIIDRLYKLSFKIRNPATRLGFSRARSYCAIDGETGVLHFETSLAFLIFAALSIPFLRLMGRRSARNTVTPRRVFMAPTHNEAQSIAYRIYSVLNLKQLLHS